MAKKKTNDGLSAVQHYLDKEVLKAKRGQAEEAFSKLASELNARISAHGEYVEAAKTELSRLQGEFRLLTQLLGEEKK